MTPTNFIAQLAVMGLPADRLGEAAAMLDGLLAETNRRLDEMRARERGRKKRWRDAHKRRDRDGTETGQRRDGDGTETGCPALGSPSPFPPITPLPSTSPKTHGERGRATRIPEDFVPHPNIHELALSLGLTGVEYDDQIERMKDYFGAKAGKDATKTDWNKTARNWIKRAADDKRRRSSNGFRRPTPGQDMRDAVENVRRMVDAASDQGA